MRLQITYNPCHPLPLPHPVLGQEVAEQPTFGQLTGGSSLVVHSHEVLYSPLSGSRTQSCPQAGVARATF